MNLRIEKEMLSLGTAHCSTQTMIFYTQLSRRFLWVFMLFMLQLHNKLLQLQPNSSKSTQQESSQKHEDEEEEATLNAANLPHDHTAAVLTRRQSTESADAWQNENGCKAAAGRLEVWKSEKQNRNVSHSIIYYSSLFNDYARVIYGYNLKIEATDLDGHFVTRHHGRSLSITSGFGIPIQVFTGRCRKWMKMEGGCLV